MVPTVAIFGVKVTSPCGLTIRSPAPRSSAARRGRTKNVTSRPAWARRPPKYPPVAPAPTTSIRMTTPLNDGDRTRGSHLHQDIDDMLVGHASVKAWRGQGPAPATRTTARRAVARIKSGGVGFSTQRRAALHTLENRGNSLAA